MTSGIDRRRALAALAGVPALGAIPVLGGGFVEGLIVGAPVALAWSGVAWAQSPDAGLPVVARLDGRAADALVRAFYAARRGRIAWNGRLGGQLMDVLANARRHGLDASGLLSQIREARGRGAHDVALTRAALAYGRALAAGLVDPGRLYAIYTVPRAGADLVGGLAAALRSGDIAGWLDGLAPQDAEYRALSDAYLHWVGQIGLDTRPLIADGPKILPDGLDPRIPTIAAQLGTPVEATPPPGTPAPPPAAAPAPAAAPDPADADTGETTDLDITSEPPAAPAAPQVETPPPPPAGPDHYGPALVAAVTAFQRQSGVLDDGVIGPETLKALNVRPTDRARQLVVNLERRRWLRRDPPATRIDVNVAAATLTYVQAGQPVWRTVVAVGKPDHQTPEIQAAFGELVVNPAWHIPTSIARKEILPKGPDYLVRHHMGWRNGTLVQTPGPWTALGRVKFDVRDAYEIYLHDTPDKATFARSARDASHGCVRVDGAVDFARRLADQAGVGQAFDDALASGRTRAVGLKRDTVVRLLYHSAFLDQDGQVSFRPDIYGRDDALAGALGMGMTGSSAATDDSAPATLGP